LPLRCDLPDPEAVPVMLAYDALREELAALEHEQWMHWTKHQLANPTPENVTRWERQCRTPYSALTEREKESDRVWADKVLEIVAGYTLEDFPTQMLVYEIAQRPDCQQALQRVRELIEQGVLKCS
jgi:hypothetical protein